MEGAAFFCGTTILTGSRSWRRRYCGNISWRGQWCCGNRSLRRRCYCGEGNWRRSCRGKGSLTRIYCCRNRSWRRRFCCGNRSWRIRWCFGNYWCRKQRRVSEALVCADLLCFQVSWTEFSSSIFLTSRAILTNLLKINHCRRGSHCFARIFDRPSTFISPVEIRVVWPTCSSFILLTHEWHLVYKTVSSSAWRLCFFSLNSAICYATFHLWVYTALGLHMPLWPQRLQQPMLLLRD